MTSHTPTQAEASASLWSHVEPPAARRLLLAAVDSFATVGYHASTTREISARAGLSPAAVYAFYDSKAALLETISLIGHEAALARFAEALSGASARTDRIGNGVRVLATWHAEHRQVARIVQQELGALRTDAHRQISLLRRRVESLLEAELRRGVETGELECADIPGTTIAILSLCIDITRWYSSRSMYSPAALGELYADLSLRMIAHRQP